MKDKLGRYRKKRNFLKTSEPKGKISKTSSSIFVVQEHFSRNHHFDFRLELNGVLISWAIPKGPSINPEEKRLAVHVENHPLDYADFEGVIPKGEYGAGKVILWDKGTWEPLKKNPSRALKEGKIEFRLKGRKLHGVWILVRTNMDHKQSNWLLIKKDDESSRKNLNLIEKRQESVKGHDSNIHFHPQLAERASTPPKDPIFIHEIKYDGYRTIARVNSGVADLFTRNGLNWTKKYPTIARALMSDVDETLLDGEIVYLTASGHSDFGKLQNAIKKGDSENLYYYVFDTLKLDGVSLENIPLIFRKELCKEFVSFLNSERIVYSEHFKNPGPEVFEESCKHGLEGIISKDATSTYFHGRSNTWKKIKCENNEEFLIIGYKLDNNDNLKSIALGLELSGRIIDVGNVGSGLDRESRGKLKEVLQKKRINKSPVESKRNKEVTWVTPKFYAQIKYTELTSSLKLRHPVFLGLREDKFFQYPNYSNDELKTFLTSPNKILYPRHKITKFDIASYYNEVYPLMRQHLIGRVLNLYRCPKGVGNNCFFNRHRGSMKNLVPIQVKNQNNFTVYDLKGLIYLVRYNALEIHTWNCSKENDFAPKEIVFDLDPAVSLSSQMVIEAAFEIREILKRLELDSFPKVTGGKGIHLHVPLSAAYSQLQVYEISKSISLLIEEQRPQLYTTTSRLKDRKSKIFIDYLRNNFGSSYICPFSTRANESATVAFPVSWQELNKYDLKDPLTLMKLISKAPVKHPWRDYWGLDQRIKIYK